MLHIIFIYIFLSTYFYYNCPSILILIMLGSNRSIQFLIHMTTRGISLTFLILIQVVMSHIMKIEAKASQ